MTVHILDLQFMGRPQTIASFLLKTSYGPMLIETGPASTLPQLHQAIRDLNVEPEEIKHVFLTHVHLDHAGAAWWFSERGANIYVHPLGVNHLVDPSRLLASAKKVFKDKTEELWGEIRPIDPERIIAVAHKKLIKINRFRIRSIFTPGHATHHVGYQLGSELFAGDVAGVSIEGSIVFPPTPPPDFNLEDWRASIKLLRNFRFSKLYLTHFGVVDDVKNHWRELEGRLQNWVNWMRPMVEAQLPMREILPRFTNYWQKQLEQANLTEEVKEFYENTAPAWLNVAGMIHYLEKPKK